MLDLGFDGPQSARICRKWCETCQLSFTLLPEDVLPLHSYGLGFIDARLMACADGQPLRSRDFYEQHGAVAKTNAEERAAEEFSWSEQLEMEPVNPSHQLFLYWRRKFAARAQVWLHYLLAACILSGCDLRVRLGKSLEGFRKCPPELYPLLLSAGLVGLLQDRPVRSCLGDTLWLLCGANTGSHKILQAPGRPSPHYGQSLEFPSSGHP